MPPDNDKNQTRNAIIWMALVCLFMTIASAMLVIANWQADSKNRIAATEDFSQAFMIAGYEVSPVGENSFTVINFTGKGNIFIDAHNLTAGQFAFADGASNKSQKIDISDGLALGKTNAYRHGIRRIRGAI